MSNHPSYLATRPGAERRGLPRTQPVALVYLDVGEATGGIVTDLTESGAGLQTVSPLEVLTTVSIRFQVPNSQSRIKTTARIVWVSESRCHAGIHFLDIAEDTRALIRQWLGVAVSPANELPDGIQPPSASPREDPVTSSRENRWLNPLPGDRPGSQGVNVPSSLARQANARLDTVYVNERAKPQIPDGIPLHGFLREVALTNRFRPAQEASRPEVADIPSNTSAPQQRDLDSRGVAQIARPASPTQIPLAPVASPAPEPKDESITAIPPTPANQLSPPTTHSAKYKVPPSATSTVRNVPSKNQSSRIFKYLLLAVGSCVICVASFRVGKWLAGTRMPVIAPEVPRLLPQATSATAAMKPKQQPTEPAVTVRPPAPLREARTAEVTNPVKKDAVSVRVNAPSVPTAVAQTSNTMPAPPRANLSVTHPQPARPQLPSAEPAPQGPAPTVVDGRVLGPSDRFNPAYLTYRFDPDYPLEAREQKVEGTVTLHLSIDATGNVQGVKPLSGPAILIPSAVAAAKNWRYLPALLNGQPVETEQDVQLEFHLPH